ncbi:MAG: T9SS type A sorting domain-containing protein, partial [Crocinitomicaceae bacterium]
LLIVSCLTFSISLNAQLVNSGFESPATPLLPGIATDSPGWGQGLYTIETSGAYNGAQYAKIKTIFDPATAGILQWPSDTISGFMQQYVPGAITNPASWTLNFAYKNIVQAGDSAAVFLQIYDTLTADPNDDVVMYGTANVYTGTTANWTMESLPVQEFQAAGYTANAFLVIASSSIGFLFNEGNGYPGSELWLDAISISTSADVIELSSNLNVYPNPANDVLNISTNGEISSVVISTLDGKVMTTSTESSVDVSNLTAGMYIYQVTVNGKVSTGNFVKN